MNLIGCGESGVVTSLFHELSERRDANSLLEQLQGRARFPYIENKSFRVFRSEVLLDVNFNKLGQSAALMLVDTGNHKISIFIQVKTAAKGPWTIQEEFKKFMEGPGAVGYVTNLFSEVYAKARLIHGLQTVGIEGLQKGLQFPPSASGKTIRKLGNNPVTLRAVKRLQDYLDDSYFVAVVPDDSEKVGAFFDKVLCDAQPAGFEEWNVKHCGYLCWRDVEAFCKANRLDRTRNALDFNKSLLY